MGCARMLSFIKIKSIREDFMLRQVVVNSDLANSTSRDRRKGQTAIEYMLLLTAVVSVVLIGFKYLFPKTTVSTELFYNRAATAIMGNPPIVRH